MRVQSLVGELRSHMLASAAKVGGKKRRRDEREGENGNTWTFLASLPCEQKNHVSTIVSRQESGPQWFEEQQTAATLADPSNLLAQ